MQGVELSMELITGSSRRGTNSTVRNSDRRDFSAKMEDTPFVMASHTGLSMKAIKIMRLEIAKTWRTGLPGIEIEL